MRLVSRAAWLLCAALGLVHAWTERTLINVDGVSYLEIADAYRRGDWSHAVNAYWSPLLSWVLAGVLAVLQPAARDEFIAAHVATALIYLGALCAFSYLLGEVVRTVSHDAESLDTAGATRLPAWALAVVGYALFLWSSLWFIGLGVKPDLLVSALLYLAAGLLLRLTRDPERPRIVILLGIVLGLGYLAKAALFPLAFVFLAVIPGPGNLRRRVARAALGFTAFAVVCAPFVLTLSLTKGRPTFGDAGTLNYAWFVNGVPQLHWQGEPPGHGTPRDPERVVLRQPTIFEYATPASGSYPPWRDPSYRYEGVRLRFDAGEQLAAIRRGVWAYVDHLLLADIGIVALGAVALLLLGGHASASISDILRRPQLWLPALAALAMYSLVLVERRYVGGFVVLLWLGIFTGMRVDRLRIRPLVGGVVVAIASVAAVRIGLLTIERIDQEGVWRQDNGVAIADALHRLGLADNAPVTCIGAACANHEWARLARVRIVAEMPPGQNGMSRDEDAFWRAGPPMRTRVLDALAATGAGVVVARPPAGAILEGWTPIGAGGDAVYRLTRGAD